MDEPTSALTETEVQRLLSIMDRLRKDGVAIMFVTHRLEEASAICDRMTVLRDGKLAGHLDREGGPIPLPRIIEKMVGRAASELYARPTQRDVAGDVRLSVRGLRTVRDPEAPHAIVLEGVDLDLKAGEILGVAGLVGSGRTELARAIFGADRIAAGTITLDGKPIAPASPADAIALGIGLVPEDRKHQAIFAALGILHQFLHRRPWPLQQRLGFMAERREREALSDLQEDAVDPHGLARAGDRGAVRRQPAEGHPRPLAGARPEGADRRRADARRRCRRQGRGAPDPGAACGARHRHHDDLVRIARGACGSDRIVTMRRGRITGEMPGIEATRGKTDGTDGARPASRKQTQ